MLQRRKIVLVAAICGAVIGALTTILGQRPLAGVPFLTVDRGIVRNGQLRLAVLGWLVFTIYWEIAAKSASTAVQSESSASRAVHVFLANVALVLAILPIRGLGRFVPVSPWVICLGVAVEACGLFLAIWSRRHLGRHWSGEITIKREHELVRSGPYRLLRHPIYTGILGMYVGTTIIMGTWLGVIGLAIVLLAYWRKIRLEETNLRAAFGAEYDSYRCQTWALMPWLF
jgi:protein-S-isoprenylcysteine O-methyltransferase Ste14